MNTKKIDPLALYEEAQVLIKDKGYIWSQGRLTGDRNKKRVVSFLAVKYAVSTRWISDCLRRGRAISRGENAPVTSLVRNNRHSFSRRDKLSLISRILNAKKWSRKALIMSEMLLNALNENH